MHLYDCLQFLDQFFQLHKMSPAVIPLQASASAALRFRISGLYPPVPGPSGETRQSPTAGDWLLSCFSFMGNSDFQKFAAVAPQGATGQ
jgi:hypothetical protein